MAKPPLAADLCAPWVMVTIGSLPTVGRRGVIGGVAGSVVLGTAAAAPAGASSYGSSTRRRRISAPETIALPDGIRPEGITSGPGASFFVGSLADGRIVTGNLRTGSLRTLLPGAEGRQLRGLFHDRRTGLVWAAGNVGAVGHVWAVDDVTGGVAADVTVPGAVFLNDLVVTGRTVWVTDSRVDRLTAIDLGAGGRPGGGAAPRFVPLSGAWPSWDGTAVNANGIRDLPDGSLILNNSRVGGLWQVDARTGEATAIAVRGGKPLTAGDGLELRGDILYDVRGSGNGEVSVIRLSRRGRTWTGRWVTALTDETLDVPSTATLAGGWLWAVNARFGNASPGTADYWITRLDAVAHRR